MFDPNRVKAFYLTKKNRVYCSYFNYKLKFGKQGNRAHLGSQSLHIALLREVLVPLVPTTHSAHSSDSQHCCSVANQANFVSLLPDTKQLDIEISFSVGVNFVNRLRTCLTNLLISKQVVKTV